MCDEKEPLEVLGEQVRSVCPKWMQDDPKWGYALGSLFGFVSGYYFGRQVVRIILGERKEK